MEDEPEHTRPINEQPAFGAGIKRKRIDFVPQSHGVQPKDRTSRGIDVRNLYLSIALPNEAKEADDSSSENVVKSSAEDDANDTNKPTKPLEVCSICNLPISRSVDGLPHESNLSHQVCLEHSHPPSALDRRRKGYAYLSSYGWDADERKGLGASGEGRLYPIQPQKRDANLGLGASLVGKEKPPAPKLLGAREVRKMEKEHRDKAKRLRSLFHGREDVNKLLGNNI